MGPFTDSPAWHLRTAYLKMHRVTNRIFRPYGITADQYVLLRLLCSKDGISQQELCRLSASDPTTIGRMLELLEGKKLVGRKTDPDDRRTRLVFLSAAGRKMASQLYDVCEEIRNKLETTLPRQKQQQLLSSLLLIGAAMETVEQEISQKSRGNLC